MCSVVSSFAQAAHVGAGSQHDILTVQPSQLRNAQTRLNSNQQKGSITTPHPSGKIRNREQRVHLFPAEKLDRASFVALIGHRQDPLAMQRQRGLL